MIKRKKERTKKLKIILFFIILLILLAFFVKNIYKLIKEPTNIFIIEKGKIEQKESTIGYIIRDEEVMTGSNYQNGIVQIKAEGEKVAKGESIFRYYSNNEENLKDQIKQLDVQIQEALDGQTDIYSGDIKIIEGQIEEKLDNICKLKDIQEIEEKRKEIEELIVKKAKIAGDLSPAGSYIKTLIEQRSSLENTLNSGSEYMVAKKSGIVSYRIDGLEETLVPNNYSNLNKQMLESLNLKTGQTVATSNKSGKVINNFECYIATILSSENAKELKENQNISLRMSNNEQITGKIEYKQEQPDDSILFVIKITKNVEELITCRKISLDVIWWSDEGLKVPNEAILEEDDKKYIVRNRAGYTDKILIKVLRQNEKYSIIENYDAEELKELGYTLKEINERKVITLHDEILLQ